MAPSSEFKPFSIMVKAMSKGYVLYNMMLADSQTAGQIMNPPMSSAESGWQIVEDLGAAGYFEDANVHEPDDHDCFAEDMEEMAPFLTNMGFNPSFRDIFKPHPGDNSFITHHHECIDRGVPFKDLGDYFDAQGDFIDESIHEDAYLIDGADKSPVFHDSFFDRIIGPANGLIVACDNCSPSSHTGI